MATETINGVNYYYELHGQGYPLVLIAGYTCDHSFWGAMLGELAERFQVLLFDNRGVGQTIDNEDILTLEAMADETMILIQRLGINKPHILGQSMGGAIAQIMGKKYSDAINQLILLNTTTAFNNRTMNALQSLLKLRKKNISLDLLIDTSMPWFFSSEYLSDPNNTERFKNMVKKYPYPQTVEDQERQFKALPIFHSTYWLQEIKKQTLVIGAEEDIICLPEESLQLTTGIVGSQLIVIPGGHASPLEQSREVNEAVIRFLS